MSFPLYQFGTLGPWAADDTYVYADDQPATVDGVAAVPSHAGSGTIRGSSRNRLMPREGGLVSSNEETHDDRSR